MFSAVTEKIIGKLEKRQVIQTERRQVYQFGINQFLNMALNLLTFFAIGLFLRQLAETFVFTVAYIPFRMYAGGFHASTPCRCWMISALMLFAILTCARHMGSELLWLHAGTLLSVLVILYLAPVEDLHKPLDETERAVYRVRGRRVFAVELCSLLLLRLLSLDALAVCIQLTWILLAVMLLIGNMKNQRYMLTT